nr:IRK-interacting protein-like [Ipomoea batatas]
MPLSDTLKLFPMLQNYWNLSLHHIYSRRISSCAAAFNIDEVRQIQDEMSLDSGSDEYWTRYANLPKNTSSENIFFLADLTPDLFRSAVEAAYRAIHDFSKPVINMMKAAGWDLDAASNSIEPDVVYAKR